MKRTEGFRSCPSKPHSSLIPALSFILRLKQFNCLFIFVAFFHYFFLSFFPYFSKAFLKCAYKSLHNDFYKCRSYDQTRSAYCKYLLFFVFVCAEHFLSFHNWTDLNLPVCIWFIPCAPSFSSTFSGWVWSPNHYTPAVVSSPGSYHLQSSAA